MTRAAPMVARGLAILCALLGGCAHKEFTPDSTPEPEILQNPIQLTRGFDGAGEAYFSNDMSWIIFQAYPPGENRVPDVHRAGEVEFCR